ncbi:hypothetical protein A1O7_08411 [Cladophialophora yegresii CBS 114405]|uniref:Transcription factor domain-containing protein n=1 Tax=Cladophialophora yegresii CBS 114405 TaxID=1182544 RepID=W9WA90_9EURO|nr:uncharacterized protein A1O7_08411 [Cladophialophora yegresii CBS 114405]EXJ55484.1 hypothetical protein A1O7_08411 [Cladophialophora yegresii CBS 114405]
MGERKKRLFWSLQLLDQYYGRQDRPALAKTMDSMWPWFQSDENYSQIHGSHEDIPPPLPQENGQESKSASLEVWGHTVQLGWIWRKPRRYVSDCANRKAGTPWLHGSKYSIINADLHELKSMIPICHRMTRPNSTTSAHGRWTVRVLIGALD